MTATPVVAPDLDDVPGPTPCECDHDPTLGFLCPRKAELLVAALRCPDCGAPNPLLRINGICWTEWGIEGVACAACGALYERDDVLQVIGWL